MSEELRVASYNVRVAFGDTSPDAWERRVDAVKPDLSEKVLSSDLNDKENVRDVMLERDRAEATLEYLATFEYTSRAHVVLALEWHTMLRRGAYERWASTTTTPAIDASKFGIAPRPKRRSRTRKTASEWSRSRRKCATCSATGSLTPVTM